MVCCMYYTDVFVGQTGKDNINNLKSALEAVLKESGLTGDLTQLETQLDALASGLGFLAGLPACLCKTKKSVEEGLKKIYEELKNFNYCISKLNCDSCKSNPYPCKCCVIQSIKAVKGCECIKNPSNKASCHCKDSDVSCAKVLAGLEACLHLQCLQSDMEDICKCKAELNCCQKGQCTQASGGSCDFCKKLQTGKSVPTTGLGLSPPNPIRLAGRLEKFFGGKSFFETLCKCDCKGSTSCCCLSCGTGKCSEACSCVSTGQCDHGSSQCPRKTFCLAIDDLKVNTGTSLMKCCKGGTLCHCHLGSGQGSSGCCDGTGKKSVKCMLRRLVTYFKSLEPLSSSVPSKENFKNCCEFICVLKTCEFLKGFLSGSQAKDFKNHLETLKHSSPCGHDLWRTLDDFIYFIRFVFWPRVNAIRVDLENLHKQHCKQCTGGTCTCSTQGSSCQGCTAVLEKLQTHKDVLSLMTRGYVSSYVNSTWESLCKSSPPSPSKCCCGQDSCSCSKSSSPCCKSSSVSCDPSQCCDACPQRKAAKIFLGMLPCLYYGLKILKEKCEVDWKDFLISNKDYSLRHFLVGMGYDLGKLDEKKTGQEISSFLTNLFKDSNGPLEKLYDVSKNYFTSLSSPSHVPSSDSPSQPKTVRDILLWLSGLPFTSGFKDLLQHCKDLCSDIKDPSKTVQFNDFESYLFDSCFLSPFVLGVIEDPGKEALENFPPYYSEWKDFSYPSDTLELFEKFCDFARKIYIPLTFLKFQCERTPDYAGWQECFFGKDCSVSSSSVSSASTSGSTSSSGSCTSCEGSDTYLCTWTEGNKNVHEEHCQNGQCLGFSGSSVSCSSHNSGGSSTCKPCPHHLLRFLCDSDSQSPSSLFKLPSSFLRLDFSQSPPVILDASSDKDFLTMGFSPDNLPTPGRHGRDLYDVLNLFCGSKTSPLTKLFDFSLFVAMRPPETLIELIAFFLQFRFNLWTGPLKTEFSQYASMEPGTPDGSALTNAIEDLYDFSGHPRGSASHLADLQSLFACDGPKGSNATCGRYLFPLNNINGVFTPEFCAVYLSWVCHLGLKLHAMFQKFHEEAKGKFSCCLSSSCEKIV
ncbi:variant erythrocyte surface antigen-1, alpha subunit [Babesia divergens]|uniref:Variant erythrocyte surface antigen-1, alpha subunit n=1 Tax=Babesia divergens TaxID=32595 RepID=A0AAD9G576_BABDI|nr:variant erythrocyte surface antigen-1, alpha subunit [Babesia divergens]